MESLSLMMYHHLGQWSGLQLIHCMCCENSFHYLLAPYLPIKLWWDIGCHGHLRLVSSNFTHFHRMYILRFSPAHPRASAQRKPEDIQEGKHSSIFNRSNVQPVRWPMALGSTAKVTEWGQSKQSTLRHTYAIAHQCAWWFTDIFWWCSCMPPIYL